MGEFARERRLARNHGSGGDVADADAGDGAVTRAEGAADALVLEDLIGHQLLADVGGALLLGDVGDVLLGEVMHRRENRVGRGLAEGA